MPRFPNCDGGAPGKVLKVVLEGTSVPPASLLIVIPLGTAEYFLEMYLKRYENSRQKEYKSPFSA